jgi:hypothetical protein
MRHVAIAAALLLALPASAAAAPTWLSPVTLSSSAENATQPDVAVDVDGDATAVWLYQSDGTNNVVQASTHTPEGSWSTPVDLSVAGENAQSPQVAADANGDVAAVWLRSNGANNIVQVATKPAGGSWSAPVNLSAAGEDADSPRVALDASGDVFVAWDRSDGSTDRLQAAVESGGTWGATATLSESGESANLSDLKVDGSGTATVVWDLFNTSGDYVVQAATYASGSWSAAQSLTSATGDAGTPSVALDASGDATVAWEQRQPDEQFVIESSSRPAGGSWSAPSTISGEGAGNTFAVADSSGNPFVAWDTLTSDIEGEGSYEVQASIDGGAAATLDSVSNSLGSIAISSLQSDTTGNAAALMIKTPNSGASTAEVAYYNAGASGWTAPVEIATYPGTGSYSSALALEADENGVAVWEAEISGVSVIEAAISSNTTITSGPPAETNQSGASIAFSSTEPDPSFRCSLDGGSFVACASPATYPGLANGQHTFAVEATDSHGNIDLAPVVTSWNVDAPPVDVVPPTISGTVMQAQTLSESHGSWSNTPTGYSYQWEDCDSAGTDCAAIGGATNQTYTLGASDVGATIRVVETARNTGGAGSPAPSNATTTVSAASAGAGSAGGGQGGSGSGGGQSTGRPAAPNTHIVSEQISSKDHTARFHFEATGESTGFQCALVRKPSRKGTKTPRPEYVSCGSPKTFKHLKAGKFELYVRAVGPGGTDETPATYKFKIT